jgi:hypothetical protein
MLDDVGRAEQSAREALGLMHDLGKTLNAMCALQHLGSVAALQGSAVRAARLCGASNRLYEDFQLAREFTEQSLYDRTVERIRHALGDDALQHHLRAGSSLPFQEAVDEALATG